MTRMTTTSHLFNESGLLTLRELSKEPEVLRLRLTYSRLHHWAFRGLKGRKLPTVLIGRVRYTTVEEVLTFATAGDPEQPVESAQLFSSTTIDRQIAQQRKQLEETLYGKRNTTPT